MTSAYDLLVTKVQKEAHKYPIYRECANNLISNGLGMSTDEVLKLDTPNSGYLLGLKYFICFLSYLSEAPKGTPYTTLCQHYAHSVQSLPQDCQAIVIPSMTEYYIGGLCKELKTESIPELIEWIQVYKLLKDCNFQIEHFEAKLSIKISSILWKTIGEPDLNIENCEVTVYLFTEAQKNRFDLENRADLLTNYIYNYLNFTYKMYEGGERNDLKDISRLVGGLKMLVVVKESTAQQINQLKEFFCSSALITKPQAIFEQTEFDINNATRIKEIYSNSKNKKVKVKIWLYRCPVYGKVAVKVYKIIAEAFDMTQLSKEIKILEKLSRISKPENCFIKLYGKGIHPKKIWFAMEYHKKNLMEEITNMKQSMQKFSEIKMIWFAKELISVFATLEEMKIYHQDIKPHNILVTSEGRLKIVDFGVSEFKCFDESTEFSTNLNFIQGTRGYMAPELEYARINDIKDKIRYKRGKADVFSLGIVLLQLYCFEELITLNYPENNTKLMEKVSTIEFHWLSTLLSKIFQLEYRKRPSFKKCLEDVPSTNTERTTFYQD